VFYPKNGGCGAETPTIVMAWLDRAIQQHIETRIFLLPGWPGQSPAMTRRVAHPEGAAINTQSTLFPLKFSGTA
jgi:hypothetical protein